jgi:hypothetical protein
MCHVPNKAASCCFIAILLFLLEKLIGGVCYNYLNPENIKLKSPTKPTMILDIKG